MTGCLYCIDNDIIQKLATFSLFDQTLALFEAGYADVNILASARYKFQADRRRAKREKVLQPKDLPINYERVIELTKALPQISEAALNIDLINQLIAFRDIDRGEAALTAHIVQMLREDNTQEVFILTGDKRYLRALAQVNLPGIQNLLHRRFWCLEQLVLRNICGYGFEAVRDKVVPVRECDTACKAIFGSGLRSTEANAVMVANSYIKALREETGSLLHPYSA